MKTEEIIVLDKPNPSLEFLSANRLTNPAHVREIMQSMKRGDWIPPIFVKDNYIVDGQHRYKAFCTLCSIDTSRHYELGMLKINSKEDPISLAIRFNSGHKRWLTKDYLYAYCETGKNSYCLLRDFLKDNPELEIRSAIQLILGRYNTEDFQSGKLHVDGILIAYALERLKALRRVSKILKTSEVFKRDIIQAFYVICDEVNNAPRFYKSLRNFQMPHKYTKTEWLKAYRLCYNNFTEYWA